MPKRSFLIALLLLAALGASGCAQRADVMRDGYYTAEMAEYDDYGWKEFITIYVNNNKIVTAEYNAKNESGFIKSWDLDYMREMNETDGTYPNEYVRAYVNALLTKQDPGQVDAVTGATHSHTTFQLLAYAAIAQASEGNTSVAFVEAPAEVAPGAAGIPDGIPLWRSIFKSAPRDIFDFAPQADG